MYDTQKSFVCLRGLKPTVCTIAVSALLAGCGGGGGGTTTATNVSVPSSVGTTSVASPPAPAAPPSGTNGSLATVDLTGRSVTLRINSSNGNTVDSSVAGGDVVELNTGGAPAATAATVQVNVVGSLAGGGLPPSSDTLAFSGNSTVYPITTDLFANTAVTQTMALSDAAGAVTLTDTSYGLYSQSNAASNTLDVTGFAIGNPTLNVPTVGAATYNGSFIGVDVKPGTTNPIANLTGDATITANFGAGTVSGNITNIQVVSSTAPPAAYGTDISLTGGIAGNTIAGTAAFTAGTATTSNSNLTGQFNGVNAVEVAGAVTVEGTAPTGVAGASVGAGVVGAFGARQ